MFVRARAKHEARRRARLRSSSEELEWIRIREPPRTKWVRIGSTRTSEEKQTLLAHAHRSDKDYTKLLPESSSSSLSNDEVLKGQEKSLGGALVKVSDAGLRKGEAEAAGSGVSACACQCAYHRPWSLWEAIKGVFGQSTL